MACLSLSVASEIINRRNSSSGKFLYHEHDSDGCLENIALGRRRWKWRQAVRCSGLLVGGQGVLSESLLILPIIPSTQKTALARKSRCRTEIFCADTANGIYSLTKVISNAASGEIQLNRDTIVQNDVVPEFVDSRNVAEGRNPQRKIKRADKRFIGTRGLTQRKIQPTNTMKKSLSKYVRSSIPNLDSLLLSVDPQTTVASCNNILKQLELSNDEKALTFFNWMRTHGKLKENIGAYNLALRVLSRKEDWNAAEAILNEMVADTNCELNFQVFNTLIFICAKRGIVGRANRWFRLMLEKNVQPSVATFGMLMGLYQRGGNLLEAELTFNYMRSFRLYCVSAYSAMITIYSRLGLHDKSERIIRLMTEDGVAPNLENWLVQLNAYSQQGKLKEAELVLKSMQKSGFPINIGAYNILITGYGKAGNMLAAADLFDNLRKLGIDPDETTYRSMIEGYGRTDNYKQAKKYYNDLKCSGFIPNSSNFYTMINLQARHHDDRGSVETLKDMKAMKCQYSSMIRILLQAYDRVGRINAILSILKSSIYENILLDPSACSILALTFVKNSSTDDALQILKDKRWEDSAFEDNLYHTLICSCKEDGKYENAITIFNQMPKLELYPNLHITCTMIDIYTCMCRFNEAEGLYLRLKNSNVTLDMVAYSIIVRMYVKAKSLSDACLILDMMDKQKDIQPDKYLYFDMLRIYQQCDQTEKLAATYYRLLKSGIVWDEALYNCVLNCCGRALPVDEVSRLFDEMLRHGHSPSTITFNIMLDIYGKAGLLRKAEKLFQLARKNCLADIISYNTLIAAYGRHQDFISMRYTAQQMQNAGYLISLEAYNSMLDAYGKDDQVEEFNDVLQKMKEKRCLSDHYTYNIMINIYGKKGWIKEVADVFSELQKRGLEPDLYSYNSLIKAYGIAGMVEDAVEVVQEMRAKGVQPDKVTYTNLISALQRNENFLEAVKWSLWMKQMDLAG